jgi:hypothetical protein
MEATLEQIHADPTIIDRAILAGELLEIVGDGHLQATIRPASGREPRPRPVMGELPNFAERRAELRAMGMRPLSPEEFEEWRQLIRSDRDI